MGLSVRRTLGGAFFLAAVAWVWFDFAVATPYFLARRPDPSNPSFAWYMIFSLFPSFSIVATASLLMAGIRLVRRPRSVRVQLIVALLATVTLYGVAAAVAVVMDYGKT